MDMQIVSQESQHNAFDVLVEQLSQQLGPCSGINSEDVDPKELERLMGEYVSDEEHWEKYFFPSSNHAYTRNLVDKGNGKSNLVSLATQHRSSEIRILHVLYQMAQMIRLRPQCSYGGCVFYDHESDLADTLSLYLFGRQTKPARYMSMFACEWAIFALI
jgi:hypothetical protein